MAKWSDINVKRPKSGWSKTECPNCKELGKRLKPYSLGVNLDKGVAKCHKCEWVAFDDKKNGKKVNYDKPIITPPQDWENHTTLSDQAVKWFRSRGIGQQTIKDCKITFEVPSVFKKGSDKWVTFNYFHEGKRVNRKYRTGVSKKFVQDADSKKVFYGIDNIAGYSECYIVEGEMDKIAMYEAGIVNCISVPNGAGDLNEEELSKINKFIIAVDNDSAGKGLKDNLIHRFGRYKCAEVDFKYGKDANDELMNGGVYKLQEACVNYTEFPIENVYDYGDLTEEEIIAERNKPPKKTLKPYGKRWDRLNNIFSVIRGQLTVVTGIPSMGKTTLLHDYTLSCIKGDDSIIASYYTPESNTKEDHKEQLIEQIVGKPYDNKKDGAASNSEVIQAHKFMKGRFYGYWIDKMVTIDEVIETFEAQVMRYGTNFFVIDAYNKLKKTGKNSINESSQDLAKLTSFAQRRGVFVFLVAHPRKMVDSDGEMKDARIPNLYDVKGNSEFYDQTHNGFAVHCRYDEENQRTADVTFKLLKAKFKENGSQNIGKDVKFKFDLTNQRYSDPLDGYDRTPMYTPVESKQQIIEPVQSNIEPSRLNALNKQSGYSNNLIDDCPF
jgi:twinkle protein